jgi:hypothetical protein
VHRIISIFTWAQLQSHLINSNPEDKLSRVPHALAFVIYRILPISSLSKMVYEICQRYGFLICGAYFFLSPPAMVVAVIGIICFRTFELLVYCGRDAVPRSVGSFAED